MIGWLDCGSGASGDMLLGALVASGVPIETLQVAVDAVAPEPVRLRPERVERASIAATKVHVDAAPSHHHRTWRDLRVLLDGAPRVPGIEQARATFRRLVEAEGQVHGIDPDEVHLHEVGALDAIADIVGVCAGFATLGLDRLTASPVALGGGTVQAAHGRLPVPGPAVVLLLAGVPTYGGPVAVELTTPTGAALLATHVSEWGPAPLLTGSGQGFGAGTRDLPGQPNVIRLVTGEPWPGVPADGRRSGPEGDAELVEVAATVDDLDPRVWPAALEALIAAGALDAWLVPVLMRKGRPGHVLHALTTSAALGPVVDAVFAETSTLGVRHWPITRRALARAQLLVQVEGQTIRVKLGLSGTDVVQSQPEWDDVQAAANALHRPARWVLDAARTAADTLTPAERHRRLLR